MESRVSAVPLELLSRYGSAEPCPHVPAKKIPADVIYLDIHYMDDYKIFTWNRERFSHPKEMIDSLHSMGFHVVTIVDPELKSTAHILHIMKESRTIISSNIPTENIILEVSGRAGAIFRISRNRKCERGGENRSPV